LVDAANESIRQAKRICRRIKDDTPVQVERVTKNAYFKKQAGLLVTTLVGAGGSVTTAVLATTQKDSAGNSNAVPATAVGAVTAGATAIAGVIALFVVGPAPEDRIKRMNAVPDSITTEMSNFDKACQSVTAETATNCKNRAGELADVCISLGRTLPYVTHQ
jgi:hypothetical protein